MRIPFQTSLFVAMIAVLLLPSACSGQDCKPETCAALVSGSLTLTTDGKNYTKCYVGANPIETILKDDTDKVFYDCTDSDTQTCTEATVNAEFSYCNVQ